MKVTQAAALLRANLVRHGGKATRKANLCVAGGLLYQSCRCRWCKSWRAELVAMDRASPIPIPSQGTEK